MSRANLDSVLPAKIKGTMNLHDISLRLGSDLNEFILFSSVAVLIGSAGQANYCAANAFMDSFASHRRANNLPALSVQWGPWADVGMAARAGTSEATVARIKAAKGLEAFESILQQGANLKNGVVGVAGIKWKTLLGLMPKVPPFLSRFGGAGNNSAANALAIAGMTQDDIQGLVVGMLQDVMGVDEINLSTPLMEMGLDSLAGVEFRNRLQGSMEGLQLSSTLMFDYPTVPDLVEYIWSQVGPAEDEQGAGVIAADAGEHIAIQGHSGRVPGFSCSNDANELWSQNIRNYTPNLIA
jgi:hypothetical protein